MFRNERDIFTRFHTVFALWRLIDEVQDSFLLILKYLDNNLLNKTREKELEFSNVKCVAKTILQILTAFYKKKMVYTNA